MEQTISSVQTYLGTEFPGTAIKRPPESQKGKKTKLEFDWLASLFLVGEAQHKVYISDMLLENSTASNVEKLLQRFGVAQILQQVGKQPVLVMPDAPRLLLDWIGPHELRDADVLFYAPRKGGVYILVEPLVSGTWEPYFVDRHNPLSEHLELLIQDPEPGIARSFFCAVVETGQEGDDPIVRDRVTTFLAGACKVEDPVAANLPPLAANLPVGLRL